MIIWGDAQTAHVKLDDGRIVGFDQRDYPHITSGCALTIDKAEGLTVDRTALLFDRLDAPHLLVGLTRHCLDAHVYVSADQAVDFKGMIAGIGDPHHAYLSTDFMISESQKPAFDSVQTYLDLSMQKSALHSRIVSETAAGQPLWAHP